MIVPKSRFCQVDVMSVAAPFEGRGPAKCSWFRFCDPSGPETGPPCSVSVAVPTCRDASCGPRFWTPGAARLAEGISDDDPISVHPDLRDSSRTERAVESHALELLDRVRVYRLLRVDSQRRAIEDQSIELRAGEGQMVLRTGLLLRWGPRSGLHLLRTLVRGESGHVHEVDGVVHALDSVCHVELGLAGAVRPGAGGDDRRDGLRRSGGG